MATYDYLQKVRMASMKAETVRKAQSRTEEMATSFRNAVRLAGESLANDTSTRATFCPKCSGGETKERAFVISKDTSGYLYWRCFRASCGYTGSTGGGSKGERTTGRVAQPLQLPVVALTEAQLDYFEDEYGISGNTISYVPELEGFSFPVGNHAGAVIGSVVRWFDGRDPKSRNYVSNTAPPFIAFTGGGAEYPLVVVEDQLSALKFNSLPCRAVALLGTVINWEIAHEIRKVSPKIVLALDRGTLPLALKYKSRFEMLFDDITIWQLDKDLKYVSHERIARAMANRDTDFITSR